MRKLTQQERERLERNATRWTMIAYESVRVEELPESIRVVIHSGAYEGDVFTSDGRARETDNGHNEPYLLFTSSARPGSERRLMLDY